MDPAGRAVVVRPQDLKPGTTLPLFLMHAMLKGVPPGQSPERQAAYALCTQDERLLAKMVGLIFQARRNTHVYSRQVLRRAQEEGEIALIELTAVWSALPTQPEPRQKALRQLVFAVCIVISQAGLKGLPPGMTHSTIAMGIFTTVKDYITDGIRRVDPNAHPLEARLAALAMHAGTPWLEEETAKMERWLDRIAG